MIECAILFLCWNDRIGRDVDGFIQGSGIKWQQGFISRNGMKNRRDGMTQGSGLNWMRSGMRNQQEGLLQGRGINWSREGMKNRNSIEGIINKPLLSERTPRDNRGLNDLEMSAGMLGRSRNPRREKTVGGFWKSTASIQLPANLAKMEGMADGDESQYTRDRDNMGSDLDSTLNELTTQDKMGRLTCNDACPSVSGMNKKWTDTAQDLATPLYGGYGTYASTTAKINS